MSRVMNKKSVNAKILPQAAISHILFKKIYRLFGFYCESKTADDINCETVDDERL